MPGGYTPYEEEVPEEIRMGSDYESYLPVIYCDESGNVRKILSIPELGEKMLEYFEGTEDEMEALNQKVYKNSQGDELYYINLTGKVKIKDKYLNRQFAYTYGDELKDAGRIPLSFFRVQEGGEIKEDEIVLPSGVFQFGPYMPIEKGQYLVTISGENLMHFAEDALIDNELLVVDTIEKTDTVIAYVLNVEKDARSIELRGMNQGAETIKIKQICLDRIAD